MRIMYKSKNYTELRTRIRDIASWLVTDTWKELILDDEPDKQYLARVSGGIDFNHFWKSGSADIVFDCQPFAYSLANITKTTAVGIEGSILSIDYPGTRELNFRAPENSISRISFDSIYGMGSGLELIMTNPDGASQRLMVDGKIYSAGITIDNIEMTIIRTIVDDNQPITVYENAFGETSGDRTQFLILKPGNNSLFVRATAAPIMGPLMFSWTFSPMYY